MRMPRGSKAVRVLLAAACSSFLACGSSASTTGPPPPPSSGPSPAAGGTGWGFFNYTPDFVRGLAGARWARATGIVWTSVEKPPGSGSYDWSALDGLVQGAQAAGLSGVLVLKAGNGSAFSDAGCYERVRSAPDDAFSNGRALSSCPVRPEMEQAWSAMVGAVVERYDGDGNADMPGWNGSARVDIQVENEAANSELWDYGEADRVAAADRYLRLLELSYQAKQAAAPGTQVILAGLIHPNQLARCDAQPGAPECGAVTVQRNLAFTRRILTRPALFDAVDVHVFLYYRFEPSYIDAGLGWVAGQMQQLGYQRPLYCLEWTGSSMLHVTGEGYAGAFSGYFPYSGEFQDLAAFQAMYAALDQPQNVVYRDWFEAEQAKDLVKLFTNMLAAGATRLVHVQYSDYFAGSPWNNVFWNWQGIVKYVGGAPVRKPSYYTYNLVAGLISGSTSARRVGSGDVRLYEFAFPSGSPAYVLWTDGPEGTVDLTPGINRPNVRLTHIVTELDAAGQPVAPPDQTVPAAAVPVRDVPVLLRGVD
jgi:hypothetical protein